MTATIHDDLDRLRSPEEALSTVLRNTPRLGNERIALKDAGWRILANDFVAPDNHPPFPAATMDGYAVIAGDASPWKEVIAVQAAGAVSDAIVTPGTAVQIMTGAPLPAGSDAVVMVEHTEPADDHVIIHQDEVKPGEFVRQPGSDVQKGDLLIPAGTTVGPAEIGVLAGFGVDPVDVSRRPKVTVVSTGDELVEPSEPLAPGKIRDSNRFSLIAALQEAGAEVIWSGKGPDEHDALAAALKNAIATSDIVLTSGGVSMGELDLVKAILHDFATVHFRRVFMKPGKPLNFATAGDVLIFGLPGNPVSALVGFEIYVRPAIAKMTGATKSYRPRFPVVLAHDIQPSDRIEFQRAIVKANSEGSLSVSTTGAQQSSRLASLIGANALLVVPPCDTPYPAGDRLDAILVAPINPA